MIKQGNSFQALFRACNDDSTVKDDLTHATAGLSITIKRPGQTTLSFSGYTTKAGPDDAHSEGAIYNYGNGIYSIDMPATASATVTPDVFVSGVFTGGKIEPMSVYSIVKYDPGDTNLGMTPADFKADVGGLATAANLALVKVVTDKLGDTLEDNAGTFRFTAAALNQAAAADLALVKAVTDKMDTALEADGGVYRLTANALEQSPLGNGGFSADDRTALDAIETIALKLDDTLEDNAGTYRFTSAALGQVDGIVSANTVLLEAKAVTDKLNDTLEDDAGTYRFTSNALEKAPAASGPTAMQIREEMDSNSVQLAKIGTIQATTDKLDDLLVYDVLDEAWQFNANSVEVAKVAIRKEMDTNSVQLTNADTVLEKLDSAMEFNASAWRFTGLALANAP